ncbi:MAG: hypothetical protein OXC05_00015 [Halieaceae bacterium]|nr:hypothetical protein [Halieaceae bacterium]
MGKSKRSFRTRYEMKHRLYSIMVLIAAFVIDQFTSDWVVGLFGLPDGSAKEWLDALYAAPFILTGLWLAAWLNREG